MPDEKYEKLALLLVATRQELTDEKKLFDVQNQILRVVEESEKVKATRIVEFKKRIAELEQELACYVDLERKAVANVELVTEWFKQSQKRIAELEQQLAAANRELTGPR